LSGTQFLEGQLASVETVFDIFLLLFEWLKSREGEVLSIENLNSRDFEEVKRRVFKTCEAQKAPDFKDSRLLTERVKSDLINLLRSRGGSLAACYGALVGIDAAFPPPPIPPLEPLNSQFRERGEVRFLPGANLAYDQEPVRGYRETGTRIENKLRNLTVCFPQNTGYSARMIAVPDHVLGMFDSRQGPTFGIVPFRGADEQTRIEVTGRLPGGPAFFAPRVYDPPEATSRLAATLDAAASHEIDILVFPELSFTPALLEELRSRLRARHAEFPKLVVAGTVLSRQRSSSYVLGPDGRTIWAQPKMNRFFVRPGEWPDAPEPIPQVGGEEDIDISDRAIRIADLPFGRVAVLVCLDFILPETYSILASMQVNCIIVPAMTPRARRFETLGWAHAAASRATTVFCNAPNCPGFGSSARSFVYTPVRSLEPQYIGEEEPWQAYMLVFCSSPWRSETVSVEQ